MQCCDNLHGSSCGFHRVEVHGLHPAYATEELDDCTIMQPLMGANIFSGLTSRWLLVVDVHYTRLRGSCSPLEEHIEIITS